MDAVSSKHQRYIPSVMTITVPDGVCWVWICGFDDDDPVGLVFTTNVKSILCLV